VDDARIEPAGRDELERRFLTRLRAAVHPITIDTWVDRPQLVTSLDINDDARKTVLRTLRVDFDGARIWGGNDPTGQLASELDPDDPDWFERGDCSTPEECAETAAAFFKKQLERPIDREEWDVGTLLQCRWTLADRGRGLLTTGIPDRPPDRVVRVIPGNL